LYIIQKIIINVFVMEKNSIFLFDLIIYWNIVIFSANNCCILWAKVFNLIIIIELAVLLIVS